MRRMSLYILAVIFGLLMLVTLMTGCITIVQNGGTVKPSSPPSTEKILIMLERTACFGACPVYSLTIFGNGSVVYEGKEHVRIKGTRETTISTEAVSQLVAEFEKAGYFSMNDSYTAFGVTDMPYANTSILIGGRTKSITHYHGDRSAPQQLTDIEDRIDEIVNSAQWIK